MSRSNAWLTVSRIGPFSVGEKPPALQVAFKDAFGAAINLSGFTAKFVITSIDPSGVSGLGLGVSDIDTPANGITTYTWAAADFTTAGLYRAQMWVGNGDTLRYASEVFEWFVRNVTSAPNI